MEKIGIINGWVGERGVFKMPNGRFLIPVNEGARFAEQFLTKEDWAVIEKAAKGTSKKKLKLSVGEAVYKLDEHPEGADRGGYVPTVDFKNVDQYLMDDVNNTMKGASMHKDIHEPRWL